MFVIRTWKVNSVLLNQKELIAQSYKIDDLEYAISKMKEMAWRKCDELKKTKKAIVECDSYNLGELVVANDNTFYYDVIQIDEYGNEIALPSLTRMAKMYVKVQSTAEGN